MGGREAQQSAFKPDNGEKRSCAGDGGEKNTFGEQLHNESGPTGADSEANSHLALATCGTGEKKIREIDAGNEKNKRDSSEQHEEFGADVPYHVLLNRDEAD